MREWRTVRLVMQRFARNVKLRNALQGMIAAQNLAAVQQKRRLNWGATVMHLSAGNRN